LRLVRDYFASLDATRSPSQWPGNLWLAAAHLPEPGFTVPSPTVAIAQGHVQDMQNSAAISPGLD
jgi:hypothetical protein